MEDITTNFTQINRILRKYYVQLYANKFDKLDGTNKFLKTHNLSTLNHQENLARCGIAHL
jgi:hypothetical protein